MTSLPTNIQTRPPRTLGTMLTRVFISFSALILFASVGLLLLAYLRIQEGFISNYQQTIAQEATRAVSNFIQEKISVLNTVLWITDPTELTQRGQKQVLESLFGLDPAFRQIVLLDEKGQTKTQVSRLSSKASNAFDFQMENNIASHLREKQPYIGPVYFDPFTSEPFVIVTVPVFDVIKNYRGALAAEVNLKFLWELVSRLKVGETGCAYVVDRNGTLLAFNDTARVLRRENVSNIQVVQDYINQTERKHTNILSRYQGIEGSTVVGIYEPLDIPNWAVVVELPWQEAYRSMLTLVGFSLFMILIMLLLVSVMGGRIARRLAVPLVHLTETATRIAGGNLGLQAQVTGPQEVASLAVAFNTMTLQLRHNLEDLQQKIVELKQAEKSLEEVNETLQALFDNAPQSLIMLDLNGVVLMWNPAAEEMFGWSSREVVGKFIKTVPEDHMEEFQMIRRQIAAGKSITNLQVERLRKDGSTFLLDLSIAPVRNAESEIIAQISIGADITERKRVEESLLRTQFTMDNTREAIIWLGEDGQLTYANEEACRLLEYSTQELLAKSIFDIDELMTEHIWPYHWEAVRVHPSKKRESRLRARNGRLIPVEVSSNFMSYAGSEYQSIYYQDITARKEAEMALRESEQKFRSVVESAQAVIFILNLEGVFVLSEGKALEKLGLRPGEAVGKSALELYQNFPSITESILEALKGNVVRAMNQLVDVTFDTVYSPYFDAEGALCGVIGIAINITEQRKAEDALRLTSYALDRVADAVYWMDADARIIGVNQSARRMLGFSEEEMLSMMLSDIDPLVTPEHWQKVWMRLKDRQTITTESTHRAKDGRIVPVEIVANYIEYGGRALDCALVRDITHRKQIEEGMRRLNAELEEHVKERTLQLEAANKELEAFAYSVSHDLRAPLRAVDGYTRILVEDYEALLDEDGRRICSVIRNETHRMGQLIDDLLAFSRLSRAELQAAPINMTKLVQSMYEGQTTPESRQRITFEVASLLPATADPSMIRQVWVNLLSNALKFSSKREQSIIQIDSRMEQNEIIYAIRDNGAGFDMQYSSKLFGVFQRLHSEREFEGTGVGLAIVQRVIHRHGGRVWAESELDKGTTFWFSLPKSGAAQ